MRYVCFSSVPSVNDLPLFALSEEEAEEDRPQHDWGAHKLCPPDPHRLWRDGRRNATGKNVLSCLGLGNQNVHIVYKVLFSTAGFLGPAPKYLHFKQITQVF